jgi:DNA modification methylase
MFKAHNHSSENMSEIKSGSIDLIIAGPPYNIGTSYSNFKDNYSLKEYRNVMKRIFCECFRILAKKGILVIESSDTSFFEGNYVALSQMFQDLGIELGFSLKTRLINFVYTEKGIELPEHGWDNSFFTRLNAHSNCHQFLVFSKEKVEFDFLNSRVHYSTYKEGKSKEHPCPFPETHFFLLDKYFKKGMSVLDPFMGTATLGVEVLKRGGNFYGYELVKEFYETAKKKLEKASKQ